MAKRQRICPHCSRQFEYEIARGKDRRFCDIKCFRAALLVKRKTETRNLKCSVEGCFNPPREVTAKYCEMHYGRLRRSGTLERIPLLQRIDHSHGYQLVRAPEHKLCMKGRAYVYEHRKVFYDVHGEGPFCCHWCSKSVTWASVHIDHLNGDKHNNTIDNLVASCMQCNMNRGVRRS